MSRIVIETGRLIILLAEDIPEHIDLYYHLWNSPEVMRNVGFPEGLNISREAISSLIRKKNDRILDALLIAVRKSDDMPIGECKLGEPDDNGIAETDIKLLPEFWGKGFGTEIKRGLLAYLFGHTECKAVKATPNKKNLASQRMQEKVGGKRVGEGIYRFPQNMRQTTVDVACFEYQVAREDWMEFE